LWEPRKREKDSSKARVTGQGLTPPNSRKSGIKLISPVRRQRRKKTQRTQKKGAAKRGGGWVMEWPRITSGIRGVKKGASIRTEGPASIAKASKVGASLTITKRETKATDN